MGRQFLLGEGGGWGERYHCSSLPLFLWLGSLYTFLPTCTVQSSHTWGYSRGEESHVTIAMAYVLGCAWVTMLVRYSIEGYA